MDFEFENKKGQEVLVLFSAADDILGEEMRVIGLLELQNGGISENELLELIHIWRHCRTHQVTLVNWRKKGQNSLHVFVVAIGEDQIGLVNDERVEGLGEVYVGRIQMCQNFTGR
jgi:hypothetical protein